MTTLLLIGALWVAGDTVGDPLVRVSYKRVGVMRFWRVGRLGGSFYWAKG